LEEDISHIYFLFHGVQALNLHTHYPSNSAAVNYCIQNSKYSNILIIGPSKERKKNPSYFVLEASLADRRPLGVMRLPPPLTGLSLGLDKQAKDLGDLTSLQPSFFFFVDDVIGSGIVAEVFEVFAVDASEATESGIEVVYSSLTTIFVFNGLTIIFFMSRNLGFFTYITQVTRIPINPTMTVVQVVRSIPLINPLNISIDVLATAEELSCNIVVELLIEGYIAVASIAVKVVLEIVVVLSIFG